MSKLSVYTHISNFLKPTKPKTTINKMKTLQLEDDKAKQLYKTASPEFKAMLDDSFGKDFFLAKIQDRIKTIEDAYKELGIKTYGDAYRVLRMPERKRFSDTPIEGCDDDGLNLMLFCRALNEGWWPDWRNSNEYKYVPYFDLSCSSGFGFEDSTSYYEVSYSSVGSRLCFKSRELAEYAGKTITPVYRKFMVAV